MLLSWVIERRLWACPSGVTSLVAAVLLVLAGCGNQAPRPNLWNEFSGARAFEDVKALVAFGPRPSGSPALERSRQYIERELKGAGWRLERQTFTDQTPRGAVEFTNLIARRADAGNGEAHAIVCTHYDTKGFDDIQFVGADDGGSGAGALMEMARALASDPHFARRFELVFFDGEEAVRNWTATDSLYGSRHYAHELRASGRANQYKVGVLWDMIGKRDLTITLSPDSPPKLTRGILAAADALGTRAHFTFYRGNIEDDHRPLNSEGIPTIDLIDFNFPPWHTAGDTMVWVSPESLEIVGRATIYYFCHIAGEL